MKAAVKVKNLTKSFGKEKVLKGISHTFEAGKIHGIMGFNGSGKTVMFKCICGFLQPDRGSVYVYGKRIGKDIDFPENTGMIIESPGFLPYISGYENLKRLAQLNRKILDEPFNGLDKRGAQDVCELFVELKEKGTTILLAAHNVMEMEWLCDTVCEMDAGQLEVVYEK